MYWGVEDGTGMYWGALTTAGVGVDVGLGAAGAEEPGGDDVLQRHDLGVEGGPERVGLAGTPLQTGASGTGRGTDGHGEGTRTDGHGGRGPHLLPQLEVDGASLQLRGAAGGDEKSVEVLLGEQQAAWGGDGGVRGMWGGRLEGGSRWGAAHGAHRRCSGPAAAAAPGRRLRCRAGRGG